MTKTLKISSIIFAFIAAIGMLFIFSGCSQAISQRDGFKAMTAAADNYDTNHVDYEKFKDSTFTYKTRMQSSAQEEIEYKESATDTSTKKKTFTQTASESADVTVVIKNVTNAAGNDSVEDIHMSIHSVKVEKSTYYSLNEDDTLKTEKTNTKTTTDYVLGTKVANGGDIEYFVTFSQKIENEGENDVVTQKYYQYADGEEYASRFVDYLNTINGMVKESFFGIADVIEDNMALLALLNFTKDGSIVEMSLSASMPEISEYLAQNIVSTTEMKASFNGSNLNKSSITTIMETSAGQTTMSTEIGFQNSASAVTVPGFNHYTEDQNEIIVQFLN